MDIYKLILADAAIGFWDQNIEAGTLYLSPAFKKMLGYEDDEVENSTLAWQQLIFIDDKHSFFDDLNRAAGEVRYQHKNGSTVYTTYSRQVIERDSHNNPVRIIGSHLNITPQKLAAQELLITKNLLNEIGQVALVGGWEINMTSKKITWTKGTRDIFEVSDDFEPRFNTETGEGFRFFKAGETRKKLMQALQEAILFGKSYNLELQIITLNGKEKWTRAIGNTEFKNGVCVRIYGTFQDINYRVKIREQLQISEQRFRGAFEYSPIGMALVSLTGQCIKTNKNICDLLGYSQTELMNKTFQEITHPDDVNQDVELFNQVINGHIDRYQIEKRYFHKNGAIVWALLNVSLVRDKDNKPLYFVSQVLNITERKQAEFALKESEAKYRKIFENVQDVFYQTDFTGIVTEVSPSIEKYSGYARTEVIGRSAADFYYYAEDQAKLIEKLMQHGKVTDFIARLKTKNNQSVYASINAHVIKNNNGLILGFEGSMRDINERKKAEEALVQRDSLFTKLSNQVPGAIYQYQYFPGGRHIFPFLTKGMGELFNIDTEAIKKDASLVFEKIHHDDLQGVTDSIMESYHHLTKWEHEFRIDLKTKGIRWIKGTSMPESMPDNSVIWHGYVDDVTEQKDRQQELQTTFNLVSEQNNRLINFAYIISHNLRTHSGNFEMLVNLIFDAHDEAEKQELLQHLKKVSSQLSETILHLNDVVSIQTTINQQRSKIKLHDYVEKTRNILEINTGAKGIRIQNNVPPGLELDYNPAYMESILFNFLSNGIKYRHAHRSPVIKVSAYFDETHLVLEIADNGSGIDLEKNAEKLFGMYRTFHDNRDAKGIGLFITKNQVEAMGGRIEVSSQINIGTTFKIYLS